MIYICMGMWHINVLCGQILTIDVSYVRVSWKGAAIDLYTAFFLRPSSSILAQCLLIVNCILQDTGNLLSTSCMEPGLGDSAEVVLGKHV